MALVSMRQLLDHAAENGYGIPAFNVNNLEQVKAIMEAADETNSPVIMQGSAGARKYAGEAFLRHLILEKISHVESTRLRNRLGIDDRISLDVATRAGNVHVPSSPLKRARSRRFDVERRKLLQP